MKYSAQNIKDAISILKKAERDFKKPPYSKLYNGRGLCYYLVMNGVFDLGELIFDGSGKSKNIYWFCNGLSQDSAHLRRIRGYRPARSRWCRKRRLELEAMLKEES